MKFFPAALAQSAVTTLAGALSLLAPPAAAQTAERLQGDVGLGLYNTPAITRTVDKSTSVLPYLYADLGRFYARVNTFGYKAVPMGNGHVELAARVSFEGYRSADRGIGERSDPVPVGLGTFQETPYGAFFLYAFRDTVSGGTLLDLMYAAELSAGPFQLYPQLGMERRSARYVQHLYGVSATEATQSGLSRWAPGSAVSPYIALAAQWPLQADLNLTFQVTKKWLGRGLTDSPLVDSSSQTSGLLALTHVFK